VTIYVDEAVNPWRGHMWAHLVSDESIEELQRFGDSIGLKRHWLQTNHYNITARKRNWAIKLGAVPLPRRDLAHLVFEKYRRLT